MKIGDVVKEVGYLYLTKVIIVLRSEVKKNIQGVRNLKGQFEARRTLYDDVVADKITSDSIVYTD